MNNENQLINEINLPVYQIFTKELTLAGLPRSLAVGIFTCLAFAALFIKSFVITIFFIVIYFALLLMVRLSPKFDPKILEVFFRFCFKKYINY